MPPAKTQRSTRTATIPVPVKFILALVPLLLGVGAVGYGDKRAGGGAPGVVTPPAIERPAAAAGADPLSVQILSQLDTINRRAERIEGKVDSNQEKLAGQIKKLQGDVDGLKAAADSR